MSVKTVTLNFSRSLDSYWQFFSEVELKAAFEGMCVLPDDFDWEQSVEDILYAVTEAAGMSVFELAEEWCTDQDDVSGPLLNGMEVVGDTVGDLGQIQKTLKTDLQHEAKVGQITVHWTDSNAFTYTAVIEVEEVFDYSKLELKLQPTYDNVNVIVDVYYDGEWVELEQEEVGSFQPNSGFDF